MYRFILFFVIACLIGGTPLQAYEFQKIDKIYDSLQKEYVSSIDFRETTLSVGADTLHQFDNSLKLYTSSSKAFLYKNRQLLSSVKLPEKEDSNSWKNFLKNIYENVITSLDNQSKQELENLFIKNMTVKLDSYSRIENNTIQNATFDYTLRDDILYIRLSRFDKGIAQKIEDVIGHYRALKGLILDLRDNHGGYFDEAIKIADMFLDNALITYSVDANQKMRFYTSSAGDVLNGKKLAILTNEHTASASEIVVAALSEQSRAVLIGTKTYGKGSIQRVHNLGDKTLYMTNGYFYSPSGKDINHIGIVPEICTGLNHNCKISDKTNLKKDIQTAINLIKHKA